MSTATLPPRTVKARTVNTPTVELCGVRVPLTGGLVIAGSRNLTRPLIDSLTLSRPYDVTEHLVRPRIRRDDLTAYAARVNIARERVLRDRASVLVNVRESADLLSVSAGNRRDRDRLAYALTRLAGMDAFVVLATDQPSAATIPADFRLSAYTRIGFRMTDKDATAVFNRKESADMAQTLTGSQFVIETDDHPPVKGIL